MPYPVIIKKGVVKALQNINEPDYSKIKKVIISWQIFPVQKDTKN